MRLLSTGGNSGIATPNAGVTPVVVYEFVLRLSREVAWRIRRAGGNFSTATSCARVTLVVAPGCVLQSSRGRQGESGTLELAPGLPRTARIKDLRLSWPGCVLRLLREVQDGSKRWIHTPELPRPVRQSAVRNQRAKPVSFGRPVQTLRMTPVCVSGLSREAWYKRCAQRQPRPSSPSGDVAQWLSKRQRAGRISLGRCNTPAVR